MDSKRIQARVGNNQKTFILGMLIVFIGYISWGMFTISYKAHIYETMGILFTYLTAILYIVFSVMLSKAKRTAESRQLRTVSCIGFIISVLLLFRVADNFLLLGAWIIAFGFSLVYGRISEEIVPKHILLVDAAKKYRGIILILIISSLFLYDTDAVQARWDGLLYYLTCKELDISSLSNLAVYGHIAQTYGMLNGIGNLIVENTFAVMVGLNILLMLSSIIGFYMLLREMVSDTDESQYMIATVVYAWSPFVLGMVYYHSLDFYCGCLFVWVLYALYKRKWIYFSIFSLLFCFTKEPAIIIYAAMCAGTVIWDILEDSGYSFFDRLRRCFVRKQYYLMVLTGILWLVTYKILGPWSAGNGGFSINVSYVLDKLKNLYVLNFNWIFTLLAVGGSMWILFKKGDKQILKQLIPIWCSQIAFTLFSCIFNTVNHPRYNDTNQVTLYLLALVPLLYYCEKKKGGVIIGCLSILCLLSSFVTCDPVTRSYYDKADIGKATMIYTTALPLGDSMIYNRQMLGFETALDNALEDALCDGQPVLFPTLGNNAYAFDGMAKVGEIADDYMLQTEFWDEINKRRVAEKRGGIKEFQVYQLTKEMDWDKLEKETSGSVNYIYIPNVCDLYSGYIKEHYQILEEMEYEHRGWVVKRVRFIIR